MSNGDLHALSVEEIVRRDPLMDRERVLTFFENFARAEYALKRAGYISLRGNDVSAGWDDFADFVEPRFRPGDTGPLAVAMEYFFSMPPRKQVLIDGRLGWAEPELNVDRSLRQLLVFVRRVRNNLFHGGKFPGVLHDDPERNNELLAHGLQIILAVMAIDPDVLHFFRDE